MKIILLTIISIIAAAGHATAARAAEPVTPFAAAARVDAAQLQDIAGQADLSQSVTSNNTATVSNNRVSGTSVTGNIAFDSQSFQNMNGLTVLSANTGNNVAINSALNVNVSLHP